jgi:ABC-2 type transport system permease protein
LVLAFGIITSEVDHAVMVYRDVENMARFPIYIYTQPLQSFLMFVIPIGLIFTIPAQVLLGGLSWQFILLALALGISFFSLSIYSWSSAVKKYSSASS